ncbi:MAG: KpsF/GutQ family sugar-phosphate isomerase [Flavobacteriales bacterium]|nr:KpsF/GutQ family sugar-phosphate isomerase [Flavobacteriales bacterium]
MKSSKEIIEIAEKVIRHESQAISHLSSLLDEQFSAAVTSIYQSSGRLIITGIGKSAIIANKIVATLNSTGQPSMFMHAADAIHGDLGMIQSDDLVLCISKSGNTPEIKVLVPLIKNLGNQLIAMTSNKDSFLAEHADYVFQAYVDKEACPNNLAPTTSTTAQLVLGDALAVALLEMRAFTSNDFAKYHPGGSLGKKLYLRVEDIVHTEKPQVSLNASLQEVIIEISSKRLGATVVVESNEIHGLITDGDLRRMLQKGNHINDVLARDIMSEKPKCVSKDALAAEALAIMEANHITQLVVENDGRYVGIVHLHDILKEGIL